MGFLTTKQKQYIIKGGLFKATFVHDKIVSIKRINPLCNCIKYKFKPPDYTFWYKANKTSNKIVVITYEDDTTDFLELQAIVHEN